MFAGGGAGQSAGEESAQRPNADGVFGDVFEEVRPTNDPWSFQC